MSSNALRVLSAPTADGRVGSSLSSMNLDPDALQKSLDFLPGARVMSVEINDDGSYDSGYSTITNLPAFCHIRIGITGTAHTAHVSVWAPQNWNGRFLATAGGGNHTENEWVTDLDGFGVDTYDMAPTMASAIRRDFATATTDAGIRDERDFGWGLDLATSEIDGELTENWHHRATKDMADVAKALLAVVYGEPPSYSYLVGTSGGGRQTMVTAQKYPQTFDGYWASCPAVNSLHIGLIGLWPAVVMKELGSVMPAAKFEEFRRFALETLEGAPAVEDGFLSTLSFPMPDARLAVGRESEVGALTELDAEVMHRIWSGPHRRNGERIWFGLPAGAETWGSGLWGMGWISYQDREGALEVVPLSYATEWAGPWIQRNPDWDWHHCDLTEFEELFDRSLEEFSDYDCSDPDFSALRERGGRLLLTHATGDGLIPAQGTVHYHDRIIDSFGDPDEAAEVVRFFLAPGGGHSSTADGCGVGISLDEGLSALMEWVEHGKAPDVLIGRRTNRSTGEIEMTRPVCRYPETPTYLGGDRRLATNFACPE